MLLHCIDIRLLSRCDWPMCVCQAMSSPEERAYEIMRELDVSYVLVIFGGLTGYSSDGKCASPNTSSKQIQFYIACCVSAMCHCRFCSL